MSSFSNYTLLSLSTSYPIGEKKKPYKGSFFYSMFDYGHTVAEAPNPVPITPTLVRAAPVLSTQ